MDSLKIGDLVKTGITLDGKSKYSRVISSMHVDPHAEVDYRQIFTGVSPTTAPLEISDDHFLYLHDNKVIRARDVQVSDKLKGDASANMVVIHIKHIQRQGLYAPATENGLIWVSGVTASSYISLLEEGSIVSTNKQAMLSHMALAPLRMVCNFGSFSICQNETYSEDGYSMNLWTLIQFGHYFLSLTNLVQVSTLIVVAPLLLALGGLEMALHHGMWVSMLTVGIVVTISKMKTIAIKK
jgi:hypothetical protein